jgi:hypothetical protein
MGLVTPWPWIISNDDLSKLRRLSIKRPRRPEEFSNLLSEINLRVSQTTELVSPHCVTSYMPPSGDGIETRHHNFPAGAPAKHNPFLLFGIDVTEMMRSRRPLAGDELAQTMRPINRLRRPR